MANRKVGIHILVDNEFFGNLESQRKKMQQQLGVTNLSRTKFLTMIKGFKIKFPRQKISRKYNPFSKQNRRFLF